MTPEQAGLLAQASASVDAAKVLRERGHYGFAASRAYYAMFYVAEALLLGQGLAFSKHSAVHAAFGQHLVKTGVVPARFHRYLLRAMEVRHTGDYGRGTAVSPDESAAQIARAEEFLEMAQQTMGPGPPDTGG